MADVQCLLWFAQPLSSLYYVLTQLALIPGKFSIRHNCVSSVHSKNS